MAFGDSFKTKINNISGFGSGLKTKTTNVGGFGSSFGTTDDLSTSQGLYNLASQSGFKQQADQIVAKNSGETNQIFSGGVVSDFFDLLNTLDYGVVGMLKGQSFMDGVKNRESFADEDALGKGLGGKILGTVLDIAVDPLTYIAPATILKKIPGATKLGEALKTATFGKMTTKTIEGTGKTFQELEGGNRAGKFFADKFAYMFGKDQNYRKAWEKAEKNIGVGNTSVKQMAKGILNLSQEKAEKLLSVGEDFRFDRAGLDNLKLQGFTDNEIKNIEQFGKTIDDLGQQYVDLGLLGKDTYLKNKGKYLKAYYGKYELEPGKSVYSYSTKKITPIKARKDLTPEQLKELGQIKNPAYVFSKTAMEMIKNVENTKFFNEVADKFGTDVAQEGFKKITGLSRGALAGKYVPKSIADDIEFLVKPIGDVEKAVGEVTKQFKIMKVLLNPASHIRNIMSNKLLNNFDEEGLPLWRIDRDLAGWNSVIKKDKWYKEVEKMGGAVDTFTSQELGDILNTTEKFGKVKGAISKVENWFAEMYQREELGNKMSMYIFQRGKGLNPEDAWKIAERATFNYSQVTPFIRKMRSTVFGFPFITFAVKSTPVVAKTVMTHPTKISNIGKIKNSIEKLSGIEETERERASEPSWVRNGFYVKLPMKDEQGRSSYFDLTYILPFGDLANLGDETNLGLFSKSPAFNLIKEIGTNQDFYGNQIWKESDSLNKRLKDLMNHVVRLMAPPWIGDQLPGGYSPQTGERQKGKIISSLTASPENQKRNLMEEMLRMVGAKIQPIDADIQETHKEWNTKKDLEKLLQENQIGKKFQKFYVPK